MIEIKDLLLNFKNILLSEENKKEIIINIIKEVINFQIKKEDIKIKNEVLYLNIKSIYKNEIFINKDIILFKLKESLGKKSPLEIR